MRVVVLALALASMSCGGASPRIEDARSALNRVGTEMLRVRAIIIAACIEPAVLPEAACSEAQDAFNRLQGAYTAVDEVLP